MAANDEFLTAYFTDSQTEMRWRREVEYKLLASLIPLCPALVAGLFALSTLVDKPVTLLASIGLTAFVWILYWYVRRKVKAENSIYNLVGQAAVRIWDYFELFSANTYGSSPAILPAESRKYGTGPGYKLTLNVFFWISVATTFMLLGIGGFALYQIFGASELEPFDEATRLAISVAQASDPGTKHWKLYSLTRSDDGTEVTATMVREGQDEGYTVTVYPSTRTVGSVEVRNTRKPRQAIPTLSITEAQERLYTMGYYKGRIDGKFGPLTRTALQSFQRTHNLAMTGELDIATITALSANVGRHAQPLGKG